MRSWLLKFLIGCLLLPAAWAAPFPDHEIHLASDVWPGHTEADGTGLGWDILRRVYEPEGIQLKVHIVPYTRSIGLVQRGEADAWVGSYRNEAEGAYYPRWHYDVDQVSALSLNSTPVPSLATLGRYRLAWIRGYDYQNYLPNLKHFTEIQRRSGILSMLELGHVDFYIDARTEVDDVLDTATDRSRYRVTPLLRLPLYLGFADTPRGRRLADIFDRRMTALVTSGELRPLFKRWKQPYAFDKEPEKPDVAP
ncbi:ABC transporter substrate-binding protein [Metapseudomonas lalkuanensis]|uniref:ABC transporter substrate-binding protein n=1 Tax=Metapseudomonas lalkuanensis TaxID=2604832 RepID=A0A5J6QIT4_9GAMM|nr:transporter substrate-binding domain-containing protein [Pseudomonas lalkuanensis]QEY61111.1 ABC transporter substrate-binding protein [Pseudomonas lalkuanensis]UCO98847.1 transporter substrate-binding domain-containing protein [Pseudomonas lalkuanensis]